jgi:hypothetical protein
MAEHEINPKESSDPIEITSASCSSLKNAPTSPIECHEILAPSE